MSEEQEYKLEDCPFCGGKAKMEEAYYDYDRFWVECAVCGGNNYAKEHNGEEEAIEAWNARVVNMGGKNTAGTIEDFLCYLIDKHEKQVIYEESIAVIGSDFLKSDYNKAKEIDDASKQDRQEVIKLRLENQELISKASVLEYKMERLKEEDED